MVELTDQSMATPPGSGSTRTGTRALNLRCGGTCGGGASGRRTVGATMSGSPRGPSTRPCARGPTTSRRGSRPATSPWRAPGRSWLRGGGAGPTTRTASSSPTRPRVADGRQPWTTGRRPPRPGSRPQGSAPATGWWCRPMPRSTTWSPTSACCASGAVAVPLNGAYREPEVHHVVGDAGVAAAVTDDAERGRWIAAAAPGAVVTPPDLSGLPATAGPADGLDAATGDDPALLVYTSGTTGRPRARCCATPTCSRRPRPCALAWRWTPDDRLVLALPLFHMHGLGVGLHGTLARGRVGRAAAAASTPTRCSTPSRAGGDALLRRADDVRTGSRHADGRRARSPGCASCVSGSAPLPRRPARAHRATRAGRPPLERYGMTETVMLVSNPYDGERRPGTVGFPLPGVELRLRRRRRDRGARAQRVRRATGSGPTPPPPAFTDGRLVPHRRPRRVRRRRLPPHRRAGQGAHHQRRLTTSTRARSRTCCCAHPARRRRRRRRRADAEWGERVSAFVVAGGGRHRRATSTTWCAARLAPYKRPRRWERTAEVPRNALGKVVRHELADRL